MENMEKMENGNSAAAQSKAKAQSICAVWDFRANEELYGVSDLEKFLKANCKKYAFQKERSDNAYIHWQGRFSLIKKRNKSSLMKLFDSIGVPNYLAPTSSNNYMDEYFYALKEDTRIGSVYMDSYHIAKRDKEEIYIPIQYLGIIDKLYPYQRFIVDSLSKPDYRSINLLYSPVGNEGKSTIASLCELYFKSIDMPILNDYSQIVSLLCNICMDKNLRSPSGVFFDMPRATSKTALQGFFSAIEQIKKGKLFDTRYHYKEYWIDSPTIWVFTNEMPDQSLLSADRWKVWTIESTNDGKIMREIKHDKPKSKSVIVSRKNDDDDF